MMLAHFSDIHILPRISAGKGFTSAGLWLPFDRLHNAVAVGSDKK
jgi:hypothetical protein